MGIRAADAMSEHCMDLRGSAVEPRRLRNALGRFATGVTVVTTCSPAGKLEGLTANSFSSVSLDPPLVLWSLHRQAPSLDSFLGAGRFAVNVLGAGQAGLSRHFARPAKDKFGDVGFARGLGDCPLLSGCLAHFECATENTVDGGDHVIFIGRVERACHRDGDPLIYSAGEYCTPAQLCEAS